MRNPAGMTLLLLLLTCPPVTAADSEFVAGGSTGVSREEGDASDVHGRKVYFMDGSVGFVRPDGVVLFEEEPKEPPPPEIRIRVKRKEQVPPKKEEPEEPDWYRLSKPTDKAGERIWIGPPELFRFGDQSAKVLTINDDGSKTVIQTYADGSRLIDNPASPHLRRILPDGTVLLLKRR